MRGTRAGLSAGLVAVVGLLALPGAASAATLTVTTSADEYGAGAGCALREAVQAARDNAPFGGCPAGDAAAPDTVALGSGSYALTRADVGATDESANATGDLDVVAGGPLTIAGTGLESTTIATALPNRLVQSLTSGLLTFRGVTLDGGDIAGDSGQEAWGASIRAIGGTLTLDGVRVTGGEAALAGGLYTANSTTLRIVDSVLDGNVARRGGALGIANSTAATIERSTIRDNAARAIAGEDAEGGAIVHSATTGSLTIVDSELSGNDAVNTSAGGGDWAAGGAIRSNGPLAIVRSLLVRNEAQTTGGTVEHGGALYLLSGASVVNSTFHDNAAHGPNGRGGAIYASGGEIAVRHATFLQNASVAGGDDLHGDGGTISVGSSILPGMSAWGSNPCGGDTVTSGGYNAAGFADPECGFAASDNTAGADLGVNTAISSLASNGGPTRTIVIPATSTAHDLVPAAACGAAGGTDQRGAPWLRPYGAACDAGALELQPPPPPPPPAGPGDPGAGDGRPGTLPRPAAPKPPSNAFRFGKLTRRPAKGTATLVVHVPGAGRLVLARTAKVKRNVKRARRGGPVRLTVRPRGRALRKLERDGGVRVRLRVGFTPSGGKSRTRSKTVELVKRLD
jgi:CSLREA domain-containing protein